MSQKINQIIQEWRSKLWLYLICLSLGFGLILALFWREIPPSQHMVLFSMLGLLWMLMIGLGVFFHSYLTTIFVRPLVALARAVEARDIVGTSIETEEFNQTMVSPLAALFQNTSETTNIPNRQNSENRLAEILHRIDQSILIVSSDHRILLVNQLARDLIDDPNHLALGRDLGDVLEMDVVHAALLRQSIAPSAEGENVLIALKRTGTIVSGTLIPLADRAGVARGYALTFHDMTAQLITMQEFEKAYEGLLKQSREFATLAALQARDPILMEASKEFANQLRKFRQDAEGHWGRSWPKMRMALPDFLRLLGARTSLKIKPQEAPVMLRIDAAALVEAIASLIEKIEKYGLDAPILNSEIDGDFVKFKIRGQGKKIPYHVVEAAMRTALTQLPASPTAEEVLRAHGTEIWPHVEDDQTALVFQLPKLTKGLPPSAARPEYYQFELPAPAADLADFSLRDLSVVVFDCETTGLEPNAGDQVVQISAVRVIAGKVVDVERFDQLVNPCRSIPAASTQIHGIDNAMVVNAPIWPEVLTDFHQFCHGQPLLAHNAAFDMAFIRKGQGDAGVSFEQPVLDTVYMSAFLFDHTAKHHLDDLARRLGVEIPEFARHTAMGDAMATAEIYVRLIPMLEARGVQTLTQMLEIGQQMRKIRRQQSIY